MQSMLGCIFLLTAAAISQASHHGQPNIVIIYADDMGYGDLAIQNPDSKIPTPHLDQLAREGMRFTDAHSSSGICSPSRWALLTGTYHWRRQHGIVNSFGPPFFRDEDYTLPQMLKEQGYTTACIGKWHLGFDWVFHREPQGRVEQWGRVREYYLPEDVVLEGPIAGGPLDRGFDYYFGDGTINFPPYAWMENDRLVDIPTAVVDPNNIRHETKEGNWEFRPGPQMEDWDPYEVLPTLTERAVEWVHEQSADQPFFFYFPLPSPHAPIIPNEEFVGKSQAGGYGDFMVQTDWVAGQVLQALEDKGLAENTLVIFTSDNGPERYAFPRVETYGHISQGELRGLKRDVWEGGHRVPFIIKWPGHVPAETVSHEVISQVDIMATIAAVVGAELPEASAYDSYDFLPFALGSPPGHTLREATVHNTFADTWGLRQGDWLYINQPDGEHSKMPNEHKAAHGFPDFETPVVLFNLAKDPGQRTNLSEEYPDRVKAMAALLKTYQDQGYSVSR